jgi:hypothetical protein
MEIGNNVLRISGSGMQDVTDVTKACNPGADSAPALEAVVGVDTEAQDRSDFYGLVAAHGRLELPTAQGKKDFCGHIRRSGFQDADVFQVAGSVESARNYHAGVGQAVSQIGAHCGWGREGRTVGMAGGRFIGEFHDHRAHRSIEIGGVLLAPKKILVGFESSSGSSRGDHGYA